MTVAVLNARVGIRFRVLEDNGAHVRVAVFTGRNVGAFGHAGELVIRSEDWPTIRARLGRMTDPNLLVLVEGLSSAQQTADQVEEWAGRHDSAHPVQVLGCPLCLAREDERRAHRPPVEGGDR